MKQEQQDALRKPFPKEKIQKLDAGYAKLDYVSHAWVTDRLLEVDPEWTWEPVAFDANGLPAFDENGGLWIKLTVCGVTRYGYGEPQGRDKFDAKKGAIGNSLRNAAMRFGIALDLWAKEMPVEQEAPKAKSSPAFLKAVESIAIAGSLPELTTLAEQFKAINFSAQEKAKVRELWNQKKAELGS